MIFKRLISLILTAVLLIGCSFSQTVQTVPVTVEGAIFGGGSVNIDLKFDSKWVTAANNKAYNSALASFSALLSDDIYFRSKDLPKGTANRVVVSGSEADYTQTALLEKLGYTDVRFIESFKQKSYDSDTNDSVTMLMAYKNIGGKYDSFIFVLRGCFSAGERLSAYDIGSTSAGYGALTGTHAEWTDKAAVKGFDIAANRAMEFIGEYIAAHDDPGCRNTALVTGHSRGASIANIIGARLEKDGSVKSYTYTFNTMSLTSDADAPSYSTVFNIFDKNDYYTDPIPFGSEKLFRYGRDISLDIAGSDKIKSAVADLKGKSDYTCMAAGEKAEYNRLFGECFPDRASLYNIKTKTEQFTSEESMNERLSELSQSISGLGIGDFVKVSENAEQKTITVDYCGAALLFCIAQIQAYGDTAYSAVASLFSGDTAFCRLAEITRDTLAGTTGGHLLINSYVLAEQTKFCW